jgi:Ca2+-binding RTX toxin-like protein
LFAPSKPGQYYIEVASYYGDNYQLSVRSSSDYTFEDHAKTLPSVLLGSKGESAGDIITGVEIIKGTAEKDYIENTAETYRIDAGGGDDILAFNGTARISWLDGGAGKNMLDLSSANHGITIKSASNKNTDPTALPKFYTWNYQSVNDDLSSILPFHKKINSKIQGLKLIHHSSHHSEQVLTGMSVKNMSSGDTIEFYDSDKNLIDVLRWQGLYPTDTLTKKAVNKGYNDNLNSRLSYTAKSSGEEIVIDFNRPLEVAYMVYESDNSPEVSLRGYDRTDFDISALHTMGVNSYVIGKGVQENYTVFLKADETYNVYMKSLPYSYFSGAPSFDQANQDAYNNPALSGVYNINQTTNGITLTKLGSGTTFTNYSLQVKRNGFYTVKTGLNPDAGGYKLYLKTQDMDKIELDEAFTVKGYHRYGNYLMTASNFGGVLATDQDDIIEMTDQLHLVVAGKGDDIVTGTNWSDLIFGNDGNDTLKGGRGDDEIQGGGDDDYLHGGLGNDKLLGGDGDDNIIGGDGDDYLRGNAGIDNIQGGDGKDVISGGDGADLIGGGDGADFIDGGAGNDYISAGNGKDRVIAGSGDDVITLGNSDDIALGGDGNDIIRGGSGNDSIVGGSGHDTLMGGVGNDLLSGSKGNDKLYGGTGYDYADYRSATGAVVIDLSTMRAQDGLGGTDHLYDIEAVITSKHNDVVKGAPNARLHVLLGAGDDKAAGGSQADKIEGQDGNDKLSGGGGNDIILGGDGNDTLKGQTGDDFLKGDAGNDYLLGGDGKDTLIGGSGADFLGGGWGDDDLFGGSGNDTLGGDSGNDYLDGGDGYDTVVYKGSISDFNFSMHKDYLIAEGLGASSSWADSEGRDALKNVERLVFWSEDNPMSAALNFSDRSSGVTVDLGRMPGADAKGNYIYNTDSKGISMQKLDNKDDKATTHNAEQQWHLDIPNLVDVASMSNGLLLGARADGVFFEINTITGDYKELGQPNLPGDIQSIVINSDDDILALVGQKLFRIDLELNKPKEVLVEENFDDGKPSGWKVPDGLPNTFYVWDNTISTMFGWFKSDDEINQTNQVVEKTFNLNGYSGEVLIEFDFLEFTGWHKGRDKFKVSVNDKLISEKSYSNKVHEGGTEYKLKRPIGSDTSSELHKYKFKARAVDGKVKLTLQSTTGVKYGNVNWALDNLKISKPAIHKTATEFIDLGREVMGDIALVGNTLHVLDKSTGKYIEYQLQDKVLLVDEDFSTQPSGWSTYKAGNSKKLGDFMGTYDPRERKLGNITYIDGNQQIISKTFNVGKSLSKVKISFDFLEVGSWNGGRFNVYTNGTGSSGLHYFSSGEGDKIDGGTIVDTNTESHYYEIEAAVVNGQVKLGFDSHAVGAAGSGRWAIDNLSIYGLQDLGHGELPYYSEKDGDYSSYKGGVFINADGGLYFSNSSKTIHKDSGTTKSIIIAGATNDHGKDFAEIKYLDSVIGSAHDDMLKGNVKNNTLIGLGGADTITGMGGDDLLKGGDGSDTYKFGQGFGKDIIKDSIGNDVLVFDDSFDREKLYMQKHDNNNDLKIGFLGNDLDYLVIKNGHSKSISLRWEVHVGNKKLTPLSADTFMESSNIFSKDGQYSDIQKLALGSLWTV